MAYAYRGRKERKRQMRALWITRLNAAARLNGLTYGTLVSGLGLRNSLFGPLTTKREEHECHEHRDEADQAAAKD